MSRQEAPADASTTEEPAALALAVKEQSAARPTSPETLQLLRRAERAIGDTRTTCEQTRQAISEAGNRIVLFERRLYALRAKHTAN